jgi:hypothetical protein
VLSLHSDLSKHRIKRDIFPDASRHEKRPCSLCLFSAGGCSKWAVFLLLGNNIDGFWFCSLLLSFSYIDALSELYQGMHFKSYLAYLLNFSLYLLYTYSTK